MEVLPQKEPSSGERPEAVGGVAPATGVVRAAREYLLLVGSRPLPRDFARQHRGVCAYLPSFGSDGPGGTRPSARTSGGFATAELSGLIPNARALDHLAASARNSGRAPEQLDPWLP